MFSKKHRLAQAKDIQLVYSRGRAFFSPYLTVKVLHNPQGLRFTVVVSTKVSKKATQRNSIKRHLRELLKAHMEVFKFGDYVITLKPRAGALEPKVLREELEKLLKKTKLIL